MFEKNKLLRQWNRTSGRGQRLFVYFFISSLTIYFFIFFIFQLFLFLIIEACNKKRWMEIFFYEWVGNKIAKKKRNIYERETNTNWVTTWDFCLSKYFIFFNFFILLTWIDCYIEDLFINTFCQDINNIFLCII